MKNRSEFEKSPTILLIEVAFEHLMNVETKIKFSFVRINSSCAVVVIALVNLSTHMKEGGTSIVILNCLCLCVF